MAVRIADKLQQFNNGTYFLMDSSAVEYIDKNGDSHSVKDVLENSIDKLTKEGVDGLLGLTKEEIEAMADLILDTEVRIDKTYSSSKIYSAIQDAIDSSKNFTLNEIGKMSGASYKVVTSTTEMTDKKIIYLLENGATYDMYIVEEAGTVTKIGDTAIDLSSYLKTTDAESTYLKKTDATTTYVAQTSFNNHITDTVAHLTQFEKNKLLTTDNITSTINNNSDNTQIPSAKATYDLANTKANTNHTHNTSDIKGLSIPSNVSELTNDAGYISEVINTLTSTDTDKPLSANQGKVLKELLDKKADTNKVAKTISITDKSSSDAKVLIQNHWSEFDKFEIYNMRIETSKWTWNAEIYTHTQEFGTVLLRCYGIDTPNVFYGRLYKGVWSWRELYSTGAADVGVTTITPVNSAITGTIEYTVKNGICYVSMRDLMSTISSTNLVISNTLPKPSINCSVSSSSASSSGNIATIYIDKNTTTLRGDFYVKSAKSNCSFSYPVAES